VRQTLPKCNVSHPTIFEAGGRREPAVRVETTIIWLDTDIAGRTLDVVSHDLELIGACVLLRPVSQ